MRQTARIPSYRHHAPSGQAVVTLNGTDVYLGRWDSPESHAEYDRRIAEWLAAGRQLPATNAKLSVNELILRYWAFAKRHYRKHGEPTKELDNIRYALKPLKRLYGHTLVSKFGPLSIKALQQHMVRADLSRGVINSRIAKIKRVFRWAESEQLAREGLTFALASVSGLQKDRCDARELPPVKPVDDDTVLATLPHMPPVVADMVRLQRLTGARPGEICVLRRCDVITERDVWEYRPCVHKLEHLDRERVILIGPMAQALLRPYLDRAPDEFCFSPAESEKEWKRAMRQARKTKVQPSQIDRSKANPKRTAGQRYTANSYLRAIYRACDKAFPTPDGLTKAERAEWRRKRRWSPNRLRHTAGTEIRKRYGVEAAQVTLGHAKADVTQIYAERNLKHAAEIMRQVG